MNPVMAFDPVSIGVLFNEFVDGLLASRPVIVVINDHSSTFDQFWGDAVETCPNRFIPVAVDVGKGYWLLRVHSVFVQSLNKTD